MGRIEKTVFLSYRRSNLPWALNIYQSLTHHGYDVFLDYKGIASGDFESVLLGNIKARAHFLLVLTPSALDRCANPNDWLRREIETAIATQRNIVPLMLEDASFDTPSIADRLTGELAALRKYNALNVPADYFDEAMGRLREKFLNASLDSVLQPVSPAVQRLTRAHQTAATAEPAVHKRALTANHYFERALQAPEVEEKERLYTKSLQLQPDSAQTFYNRGIVRQKQGDLRGALHDFSEAIRLDPDYANAFYNRGGLRQEQWDLAGAYKDFDRSIRLKPNSDAFNNRGVLRYIYGDLAGARADFDEAIRLRPDNADAIRNRSRIV